MNEAVENPYRSPSADLDHTKYSGTILQFKRFTAWRVFGLYFITLGIYPIYWLYTRANVANSIHENKISSAWLMTFLSSSILSYAANFFGESDIALFSGLIISLVNFVSYLAVLFKLKNRLQDIMNYDASEMYKINPVLTFFFSAIYLQYKINKCIDDKTNNM